VHKFHFLTRADWLDGDRAKAWRNILLVISCLMMIGWVLLSRSGLDPQGRPLGTDFAGVYAASKLALSGHAPAVYDLAVHEQAESALFGRPVAHAPFFYPPTFLMVCLPLAALPYSVALLAWLGSTSAAFWGVVRAWIGDRFGWATVAAFPAVLLNIGHGQNGFLSAALIGCGTLWLDASPWAAGVALGFLAFKPHLALILPAAFILTGRWKTLISMGLSAAVFSIASLPLFGLQTWQSFAATSPRALETLQRMMVEPGKMVSTFAAAKVLGASAATAFAAQGLVVLGVLAVLFQGRRQRDVTDGPLLALPCLLASPYLFDYDLVSLAFPLAWLARQGLDTGFRNGEKLLLLVGFVLPAINRPLAMDLHLPIAPVVLIALLAAIVARRATVASPAVRSTDLATATP